ncbi:molecular chaperone DnaJ [Erythrobacter sp. LQ02-29]|uniref:molecular chaperone DnaJ n=1 Tax=Erythrobacter sp. LQ02-29 TaxID=2920384 RepID=UPI001F4F0298|nr:molecular chaperone DnaJ [Erythrobacter sp. LQ02-29]MCP9221740.1 molecular chaperone DnaJ [Erythrobacter sp. LQ02-29]
MIKVIVLAALVSLACRWAFGKWPWDYLRQPRTQATELSRARSLLEVGVDADRRAILEAHRRVVARVHPDRGGTSEEVHRANEARDLLLSRLPEDGATQ